ncbi:hypothetical protein [Bathymodiolus platifrons methanotrophic gill symbiont]|uniref:hypothetical protein n=1 Tax=Bathymodiolus platifrons methanotrophic gill symbiont TaxID=113268 RepID=UPI001C8E571D|nr:hypothetical protein [Bathymodiolus platifrons methanotrophic gill symbiont]
MLGLGCPKQAFAKIATPRAAGFIYTLNLRNGLLRPFSLITNGTRRHQEIPVLRDELKRENRTKNSTQKCLYVYDKAVTDYAFWVVG